MRQSSPASGSHGQYLLSEIRPENGIVTASAKSAAARSNISKFRGVRTYGNKMFFISIADLIVSK